MVVELQLGDRRYDLDARVLVMAILNRTRDSFFDGGADLRLDDLLRHAERHVADGADLLDVGARPGGVGVREVAEAEEAGLVAETVTALRKRFDVPISVDTTRASVVRAGLAAGAVLGNDMSGFSDPCYLPAAADAGASVVATHIRLPPGVPDPDPRYADLVGDVSSALRALARRAGDHGLGPTGSCSTPVSTSARHGGSRCACWPRWTGSPASDTHCCSPPPTRSSWAGCWGSGPMSATPPRWPPPRSECCAAAECCASTTRAAPGTRRTSPRPCCGVSAQRSEHRESPAAPDLSWLG